jgi:hypothetical protein
MPVTNNSKKHIAFIAGNDTSAALAAQVNSQTPLPGYIERDLVALLGSNGQSLFNEYNANVLARSAPSERLRRAFAQAFASRDVANDFLNTAQSG